MNKKALVVSLAIVLLIAAGVAFLLMRKTPDLAPQAVPTPQPENAQQVEKQPSLAKGKYVDYSEDAFAHTSGTRLIFFYAPWCPQCRMLDESIKASDLPDGLTIFKLDYDSNQSLRQKYGVTLQTTVVKVDAEGKGIKNYVAYDEPSFASVSRALLP